MLVPVDNPLYLELRPSLALKKETTFALSGVSNWALHPALKETFGKLWEQRALVALPFAGTNDLTRSHFETQESIELGLDGSTGPLCL